MDKGTEKPRIKGGQQTAPIGRHDIPRKRRSQEERSAESRRKLIEAAIQLVHEAGFSKLTITGVAQRAGLTTGAVQHHFASARELLRGVIDTVYPLFKMPALQIDIKTAGVAKCVDELIDQYWKVYSCAEYLVIWEIMFGTTEESTIRQHMRSLQDETVIQAVDDLVKLFAGLNIPRKLAADLFRFITNHLRGLALLSMFEENLSAAPDLTLLKSAVHGRLAQRPELRTASKKSKTRRAT
jgi:AcrR family transcriptional regulator